MTVVTTWRCRVVLPHGSSVPMGLISRRVHENAGEVRERGGSQN